MIGLVLATLAAGMDDPALGLPPPPVPPAPAAQVALGRALFFERRLSANGTLSCAMCHLPEQGFTNHELRTSVGIEGASLRRNAPTLLNVAWAPHLFHDGRTATLEQQALQPLLQADEMGNPDMAAVVARLARWPEVRALWRRAWGRSAPDADGIGRALAAYERTLVAGGSRFDRWRYGGRADALTPQEQRGHALFVERGCAQCHPAGERDALFTDRGFHDTGVQARSEAGRGRGATVELVPGLQARLTAEEIVRVGEPERPDLGRQEASGRAEDARAYRTPTLRNVALTAPYMHDGSLATLEAVLAHYAAGGWRADPLQDPRIGAITLSPQEQADIVAFLKTLSSPHRPR